jgi:hypothetical protein
MALSKQQLIERVLELNDEAPREILQNMSMRDLKQYIKDLEEELEPKEFADAIAKTTMTDSLFDDKDKHMIFVSINELEQLAEICAHLTKNGIAFEARATSHSWIITCKRGIGAEQNDND